MILSILIPVYNYRCTALVAALQQQADKCNIEYEIIVADDGSDNVSCINENRKINAIPHSVFHEIGENHGRSWIRNWLVKHSHGQFLLFIDSDAEVCSDGFVRLYLEETGKNAVICGGILFSIIKRFPVLSAMACKVEITISFTFCEKWRDTA